jgi:NAD-dependent SIR2 family protein deacetylase
MSGFASRKVPAVRPVGGGSRSGVHYTSRVLEDFGGGEDGAWQRLVSLMSRGRVVVLTGAGCSTESGIPDYRGEGRPAFPRQPIEHRAFLERVEVRRRYWARATVGWSRFSRAEPNAAHRGLAELESAGAILGVITQNVDRLHHRAGSVNVVELHGSLDVVTCLTCDVRVERASVHRRLLAANPGWLDRQIRLAPDGDSEVDTADVAQFEVVACEACGGDLKPDVVFFGGTVAQDVVARAYALLDEASALLVIGSSLAVYSGFRFAIRANDRNLPMAVVNLGPTRADRFSPHVRIRAYAGPILSRLAAELSRRTRL